MKKCTKCLKEKNEVDFYGKHAECKSCFKKRRKKYCLKNKEELKKQRRKRYEKNKEKMLLQAKLYYENNKEEILKKEKKYYEKNRNKKIAEACNYEKNRRKSDEGYRLRRNVHALFGRFLKGKKSKKFEEYVGYSYNDLVSYLGELREGYHVDHIIPKSLYSLENIKEIKKCWSLKNLRLLPAKENLSRSKNIDWNLIKQHSLYDILPEGITND